MVSQAKSLILKAQDDLETAKRFINDDSQHDIVGYNLAQACEKYLKALCEMRNIDYPHNEEGHDLDLLMETLEENNFSQVSSHADIIDLTQYNSTQAFIKEGDRLPLDGYLEKVEDLKKLVGEELKNY